MFAAHTSKGACITGLSLPGCTTSCPCTGLSAHRRDGSASSGSSASRLLEIPIPPLMPRSSSLRGECWKAFGMTDVTLLINSIGDAQSRPTYLEALRDYFAPHAESLSHDDQRRLRENTLRVLDSKDEEVQLLLPGAPKSIDYLSDESKVHWDSLRQNLDALNIPYEIDHQLVRGLDYYTRTVFEFVPPDARRQSTVLAGGRYDGLIEELGCQPTPGIGFAHGN